jgi:hypothetical protein
MIGPSHAGARFTPGHDMFDAWAERFADAELGRTAVEVFVEVGSGEGAALFVYDGKEYWSPIYDQGAQEAQFIHEFEGEHDRSPDWSKDADSDAAMNHEFDPERWASDMLELDELEWDNYLTEVPTVY